MWNDTDAPIAYLITFRTYGTWLHGDQRGSTNRFRNEYGTKFLPPEEQWVDLNKSRMERSSVILSIPQRKCVREAIRETCVFRRWVLFGENVRTNHAHVVVSPGAKKPAIHLNAFKANATRRLREEGLFTSDGSPWSDKGSERWLWTEKHLDAAIDYVKYSQGDDFFVLD